MILALAANGLPAAGDALIAMSKPVRGGGASGARLCRVPLVIDGDTVELMCADAPRQRARLVGFDAPELFGPRCAWEWQAALRAKWRLRRMIWQAGEIAVIRRGHDRYGRALVAMTIDGRPVAETLIAAGLAPPYDGGRRQGWCAGRSLAALVSRWAAASSAPEG